MLRNLQRYTRDVPCKEGVLVEEHGATVLVEVLLEGSAGHEDCSLLDVNHVPRSVRAVGQSALVRAAEFWERIWSLSAGRRLCWSAPRAFPWVRCGDFLRNSVSRLQVRDQDGTYAIRTGHLAVPAVDPVFVVTSCRHEKA